MEKNTGKVREFCQSRKVGTMNYSRDINFPYSGLLVMSGLGFKTRMDPLI